MFCTEIVSLRQKKKSKLEDSQYVGPHGDVKRTPAREKYWDLVVTTRKTAGGGKQAPRGRGISVRMSPKRVEMNATLRLISWCLYRWVGKVVLKSAPVSGEETPDPSAGKAPRALAGPPSTRLVARFIGLHARVCWTTRGPSCYRSGAIGVLFPPSPCLALYGKIRRRAACSPDSRVVGLGQTHLAR